MWRFLLNIVRDPKQSLATIGIIATVLGTIVTAAQAGWFDETMHGPVKIRYRLLAIQQPGQTFASVAPDHPFQSGQDFRVQVELLDGYGPLRAFLVGRDHTPDSLCDPCSGSGTSFNLPPEAGNAAALRLDNQEGRESIFLVTGAPKQLSDTNRLESREALSTRLVEESEGCVATTNEVRVRDSEWVEVRPGSCYDRPLIVEIKVEHQSSFSQ